jgi:DNA-binding protein HU-beta
MNKGELIDQVSTELKTSKAEAGRVVDTVLECITKGIKKEEKVALAGFGTFTKRRRAARMGINPATKEPIKIAASRTCGFKPAAALKETL